MSGKNKYYGRSKISEAKFRQLLRLFALDLPASDAAQLCGLSLRSTNAFAFVWHKTVRAARPL